MSKAGFSVVGLDGRVPVLSFGPECTADEPVLLHSDLGGNWALSTLDLFRDNAQRIYDGEVTADDLWQKLYIILPGGVTLQECRVTFGGEKIPLLAIRGSGAAGKLLWTCEL